MADIELVIKIPEEYYKAIMEIPVEQSTADMLIIRNGTPLPKGHGRLVDADTNIKGLRKMKVVDEKDNQSVRFAIIELENAPTIIKADKTGGEDKE